MQATTSALLLLLLVGCNSMQTEHDERGAVSSRRLVRVLMAPG